MVAGAGGAPGPGAHRLAVAGHLGPGPDHPLRQLAYLRRLGQAKRDLQPLHHALQVPRIVQEVRLDAGLGVRVRAGEDEPPVAARLLHHGRQAQQQPAAVPLEKRERLELHVVELIAAGRRVAQGGLDHRILEAGDIRPGGQRDHRPRMIEQSRADARGVPHDGHAQPLEHVARADAGAHEHRWRLDRAGREHNPAAFDRLDDAVGLHLQPADSPAGDDDPPHQGARPDREVRALAGRREIGQVGADAHPFPLVHRVRPGAGGGRIVVVGAVGIAERPAGVEEDALERHQLPGRVTPDRDRAVDAVELVRHVLVRLQADERGEAARPGPLRTAGLRPLVVVPGLAAQSNAGVHRR